MLAPGQYRDIFFFIYIPLQYTTKIFLRQAAAFAGHTSVGAAPSAARSGFEESAEPSGIGPNRRKIAV
jgi:hypothetical protein